MKSDVVDPSSAQSSAENAREEAPQRQTGLTVPTPTQLVRPQRPIADWLTGRRLKRALGDLLSAAARRAAKRYIVGDQPGQAVAVAQALHANHIFSTFGYWNRDSETPEAIGATYGALFEMLPPAQLDAYVSVKAPALHYDRTITGHIVDQARTAGMRVHFDAHEPTTTDATLALVTDLTRTHPGAVLGLTLPARWLRSLKDAEFAIASGAPVRIVRGQWEGIDHPDWQKGFLAVVDRLAGRARSVSVASHNVALARTALRRLRAAGTPCDLELLYGLPVAASLAMARAEGVPVRLYVPYGNAFLPYALHQIRRNPRILIWLLRDLMTGRAFRPDEVLQPQGT